jgi:hypothetical protein
MKIKQTVNTMMLAVEYCPDVHSHDDDASDFSNGPRNLITSRLDLECTTVFSSSISFKSTERGLLSPCQDNLDI